MDPSLLPLFRPRGVAVVGVSQDPTKLGHAVARNLIHSGFPGAVHLVNPKGGTLFDRPVYADILQVPDPVDLAVLIVPAGAVASGLQDCGERGIRAAVILSGGFREIGPEGAAIEEECLRVARDYGIRLLGPNCVGLIDTHLPLDLTFLPPPAPIPGHVAFISHSGAICAAVTDWANGQGFGLSLLVSPGNQVDLTETDLLAPVAEDPETRVLTLYIEGIGDGRRFVREAAQVARQKPVIALKVGRSTGGRRAVASHTGALAGQEEAYNAAFRRAGIFRAETSEEMFDWSRALAWSPLPQGGDMAVLTNAGGPGAIAADALERYGLGLAELGETTRASLRAEFPPAASVRNPVDILATATPGQYARGLTILLDDSAVHGVLVILPPPPRDTADAVIEGLVPIIRRSAKPVVIALMGENLVRAAAERLRAAHIPDYRCPEKAASALAVLVRRAEARDRPAATVTPVEGVRPDLVRRLLAASPESDGGGSSQWAGRILAAYGISSPAIELARTAEEAAVLAQEVGFPVALKVASPDITHKSDVGGVLLNVVDAAAVRRGYAMILEQARAARPQARLLGVHVQRMILPGQEVILGALQDPQFGPLVMFGSGGVEVEGLRDVAFALAPLSGDDVEYLLTQTWAGRRLRGYRSLAPADRAAVADALARLGQLAADFPQIAEIEINPLCVWRPGRGAVAVDARLQVRPTP